MQIIDPLHEETHYWGDVPPNKRAIDIWIGEESKLNQGYSTKIMQMAIDRCFREPKVDGILIGPLKTNTKAHRFYERLGFEFVAERAFNGARQSQENPTGLKPQMPACIPRQLAREAL